jgi:DNA mismatch repair protein MutL
LARHAAISTGQVLNNDEMERLVNELFACSNVNYTPDGRAILSILPQHDIEQLLG